MQLHKKRISEFGWAAVLAGLTLGLAGCGNKNSDTGAAGTETPSGMSETAPGETALGTTSASTAPAPGSMAGPGAMSANAPAAGVTRSTATPPVTRREKDMPAKQPSTSGSGPSGQ